MQQSWNRSSYIVVLYFTTNINLIWDIFKQQFTRYEKDIAKLQTDIEKALEKKHHLAWFGKGYHAWAKKEPADKDKLIELNKQIKTLQAEKALLQE